MYIGVVVPAEGLAGSIYLNSILGAVMEIPAYFVSVPILQVVPHRSAFCAFCAFCAYTHTRTQGLMRYLLLGAYEVFGVQRLGRRKGTAFFLCVIGVACSGVMLVPHGHLVTVLAMIGTDSGEGYRIQRQLGLLLGLLKEDWG